MKSHMPLCWSIHQYFLEPVYREDLIYLLFPLR